MADARVEQRFEIPIDELWSLIGDFGDVGKWSGRPPDACVQEGEGIGSLRTLTVQGGAKIIDRLEAQTDRSYTYSVINPESTPLPYKSYRATMAVEAIDSISSKLIWSGEFEPEGITDQEAINFAEDMYKMGIGLMKNTLATR